MIKIYYGKQSIDNNDIKNVVSALKSKKITQGSYVDKFEKDLTKKFNSKYCVVVNNGTAALYLSIKSLDLKSGSKIICSPNTFFSPVYCVMMNNLNPDFCDIELNTFNIDLNKLEDKIKKDKSVKAIISVDFAGHPCDWKSLNFLKKKYNLFLINDNCHAIGAKIDNDLGYASKFADLVTHSYHPVKNITTGEGGSILTNNLKLFKKIKLLRNHGIDRAKSLRKKSSWMYEVKNFGFNFRLSDIHSALGITQLKKLNNFVRKRREIANYYNQNFKEINFIKTPEEKNNFYHSYHLYPVLINFKKLKLKKKIFFKMMEKAGINLQVHYIPVYRQKFLRKYKFKIKNFPNAENYFAKEVSFPIYYSLTKDKIDYVVKQVKRILKC